MEDLNVMGSVYGNSQDLGSYDGFNYSPQPKESLLVRATKKYTASKAASEEEKRRADAASLGTIASDIQARQIAERQKFDTLEASIARTQAMLEGPPQAQTPQLGTADYAAMLLQAVAGGGNQLGQSYQNLMGMRGQETQVANQNAQDAWRFQTGRTQDEIESLRRLQNQALEGAQYYERAGLTNQMAQAEFAQNQESELSKQAFAKELELMRQDGRMNVAQAGAAAKESSQWLAAFNDIKKSAEERNYAGEMYYNLTKRMPYHIQAETPQYLGEQAKTDLTNAKTKTENAMRDPKVAKARADVISQLARVGLTKAQTQNVLAKTGLLRPEFQLKAANIYSQIGNRGAQGAGKPPSVESYDRLIKIIGNEMGATPTTEPKYAKLLNEWTRLSQERESLIRRRVYGGGGLDGPMDFKDGQLEPFRPDVPEKAKQKPVKNVFTDPFGALGIDLSQKKKDDAVAKKYGI